MRFNGIWKLAAAGALAVTMMAPGTMMAQGSDSVLKPAEIHAVASYVWSLYGSNPRNPKPPADQSQPAAPNQYE